MGVHGTLEETLTPQVTAGYVNTLGPEAHAQGEYLVRLRLRGYAPSGQLSHR